VIRVQRDERSAAATVLGVSGALIDWKPRVVSVVEQRRTAYGALVA
jgi:hypothetical protein